MRRRWGVVGALAGLAFIAAACSSSPSPNNQTSTTTTTAAPATSTSSTTSSVPPPSSTSTSAAAGCAGVSATAGSTQGAAGTITGQIIVSETAGNTCTLKGYPTLALFTSGGTVIPTTMTDGLSVDVSTAANGPPTTVTLSPTSKVQFTYQFSDVPTGSETSCPVSATGSVTVPGNTTGTSHFALMMSPCNMGTIRVSPLYPD